MALVILGVAIRSGPHPSPLPEGEGADRGVLWGTSTWKILVIMVLVKCLSGYGFGDSGGCVSRSGPHPSPLPEG